MNILKRACREMIVRSAVGVVLGLAASTACRAQQAGGERIRQQETFNGENILSPGAHDDWPLRARDGEAVILSVSSQAFDPVVELIGPTGQVVAKNDDMRQGVQDALLLAEIAAGGDYQVRVTSSNAAAGGRYVLSVRRFLANALPGGARTTGTLGRALARWYRFRADADQTLVLTARATAFGPSFQVFAPNGEPVEADPIGGVQKGATRAVFRAPVAGTYYARVGASQGGDPRDGFAVTVATARVDRTAIGEANPPRRLDAGGLDLWTFRGEAGDLVRVRAGASSGGMNARISYVPPADASGRPQAPEGLVPPLVMLPSDPKSGGELVALLNLAGTYQVALWQPLGVAVEYTFAASRPARTLADAPEPAGALGLGGADFWAIDGTPGQVLRVSGSSERFDPELELYGPQGDLIARNDDGGAGRDPLLSALLTARGRHFVRVHAHGDGGAGPYRLRRVPDPVRPLALGGRVEGTVGEGGSEVWSFEGRAGQTVILSARSPDFDTRLALFGPDAAEVAADDDGGEGTDSLLSARLPAEGTYTVWVTANAGGGRYVLQLIDAR